MRTSMNSKLPSSGLILILALALVAVCEMGLRIRGTQASVHSVEVIPCTNCNAWEMPDTRADVVINYSAPSLYKQFISGPVLWPAESTRDAYLVTEDGKRYDNKDFKTAMMSFSWGRKRGGRYIFEFSFPLGQIPKSAGKISLVSKIVLDSGYTIPVSVVVRK